MGVVARRLRCVAPGARLALMALAATLGSLPIPVLRGRLATRATATQRARPARQQRAEQGLTARHDQA